ncbi:hypothetical protein D3C85_1692080 [compost metagenome]
MHTDGLRFTNLVANVNITGNIATYQYHTETGCVAMSFGESLNTLRDLFAHAFGLGFSVDQ